MGRKLGRAFIPSFRAQGGNCVYDLSLNDLFWTAISALSLCVCFCASAIIKNGAVGREITFDCA